jgi:SAM-dependent methyltransferase
MRAMCDIFASEIAKHFPGGSLLDIGCNNGYIPVAATRAGMRKCAGMDTGPQYAESIRWLNQVLGTNVEFYQRCYNPLRQCAEPLPQKFDVVYVSAIMCHLPDPLQFLAYAASLATEAVFYWGQVLESDHLLIAYNEPHPSLGDFWKFPYRFNDNTRISYGLLRHSMRELGFPKMIEVQHKNWIPLPATWEPNLECDLRIGSPHRGILFTR